MRLYIDLSPTEEANIHGWVNKGLNDPSFAAHPWKIVLEEQTQARFNQIAEQFGVVPAPAYPVDVQPAIAAGDYSRKSYVASHDVVTAFPFLMPASGTIHLAASEFQGQPWARLLTVSTTAGDMDAPIRSAGKVPDVYLTAGDFPASTLLYANNLLTEQPIPGSSGSGFSIVW